MAERMTPDEARALLDGTTPGPWIPSRSGYIGSAAGVMIHDGHVLGDTDADTCLIAAAPTLAALRAGMHTEYRAEYQAAGGRWFPTPRRCSCASGWGAKHQAEHSAADWKADGYATRIVRRYVTTEEEIE